jgi:excisionase family DNA binding protein
MNPPMALDQEILTLKGVSELLRVHPSTVHRMIREGRIPAFRIGLEWRFRTDRLMRWLAEQRRRPQ